MEVGIPIPVPAAVAASGNSVIKEVRAQSPCNRNDVSANQVVRGVTSTAEAVASLLPLLGNGGGFMRRRNGNGGVGDERGCSAAAPKNGAATNGCNDTDVDNCNDANANLNNGGGTLSREQTAARRVRAHVRLDGNNPPLQCPPELDAIIPRAARGGGALETY